MELIATAANGFMDLFRAGAATFTSWVTGIIPLLVIMMTAVNSLIKLRSINPPTMMRQSASCIR